MKFTKMHGLGNDYIYMDCTKQTVQNPDKLAVLLSRPHFGVGADGLVLIHPSQNADFRMQMFNADGSEGKMCGNAARCIAKYVYTRGLTSKKDITLETLSGIKKLHLHIQDETVQDISVDMGVPVINALNATLAVANHTFHYADISMGNPHCVIFCDDPDSIDLETLGRNIENHPRFPDRTNVEFVRIFDRQHMYMRVWERGSGETLACGTGACACAVAAIQQNLCDRNVFVRLKGGTLHIQLDTTVIMTGPASFVFDGEIQEDWLHGQNELFL